MPSAITPTSALTLLGSYFVPTTVVIIGCDGGRRVGVQVALQQNYKTNLALPLLYVQANFTEQFGTTSA